MRTEVGWQVDLEIRSEDFGEFRRITDEMVQSTRWEAGILIYERFVSQDRSKIFLYERYANSQAAIAHIRAFGEKYGDRFARLVKRERFLVFGAPSAELKSLLRGFNATFFSRVGGFSRLDKD